jgi:hypothetical protein
MQRIANVRGHTVGLRADQRIELPSANHFKTAAVSKTAAQMIQAHGLVRVAGNTFICRSTKDFWKLNGGKIVRITKTEVDNGESVSGAPAGNPAGFLTEILSDLTF